MPVTRKEFLAYLGANPDLEVTAHPNPVGLGRRKFVRLDKGELVFERPNPAWATAEQWKRDAGLVKETEPSFLSLKLALAEATMTDDGFTMLDGRIVYRKVAA